MFTLLFFNTTKVYGDWDLSSSKKEQKHHKSGPYNLCAILQVFESCTTYLCEKLTQV